MFIISYSDESYPQHHVWERRWVPNGNLNNLSGFPFSDHENSDGFTLLFRRERPRNVHSFKALTLNYFCAHWIFVLPRPRCRRRGGLPKVPDNEQSCPKQMWKTGKCADDWDRYTAFKLPFEMIVNVFVHYSLLVYRKGNHVSNIMDGNFWFDGDFYVRNLDASVELRHYQLL